MTNRPNIVYVLVDDMGYGDASCLNPVGRIRTPNIDRLAAEGMTFTDAHSTSAVCTPSRYSILTGRYNWRSTLQRGIVHPFGSPLIAEDRLTVAGFLRDHGYHTACIGKWHLGMGWDFDITEDIVPQYEKGKSIAADREPTDEQRELWRHSFSRRIHSGPTARGFDWYFGVDVPNWPPYCYIENDHTVGIPSEFLPKRLVGNNLASIQGPAMPYWHFEQLLPTFSIQADRYIGERALAGEPFFLYMPLTSPHTPLAVNKPWIGKSGLNNLYADLVMETDDVLGRVLDSLDRHGVAHNTMVVFASDNGCAPYIGAKELEAQGHYPSARFRGYKSDAWDGGHRIPHVIRWPGHIEPGSISDQLVSLSDFTATCAEIVGHSLSDNAAEDSVSMMPLFRGDPGARTTAVQHSIEGKFAIRDGRWKLVLCPGSGGWTYPDEQAAAESRPLAQLYDMETDPGETTNLVNDCRDEARRLLHVLRSQVDAGRSTPGPAQRNDVEVDIWKRHTMPSARPQEIDDL